MSKTVTTTEFEYTNQWGSAKPVMVKEVRTVEEVKDEEPKNEEPKLEGSTVYTAGDISRAVDWIVGRWGAHGGHGSPCVDRHAYINCYDFRHDPRVKQVVGLILNGGISH